MTLQSNTINPDPIILKELDDILACEAGFVACTLDAVIIVVELCSRVGGCCGTEGDLDIFWPEDGEEGVIAVCAVVVQGFV